MLHHALKMATITEILESVCINDSENEDKPLSRNIMKSFSLRKTIKHNKASLSTITFWQWKIAEHIYMIYRRGIACSADIDLDKVLVDKDMKLISTSIISKSYEINESSDACLVNVILNLHMSIFRLVNSKYYTYDEFLLYNMLRTFGNYFYSAVVSDTDRNLTIPELVKYSEMLHKVTTLGMFKEITEIISKKNVK
jgi:hypothetical protein